LSLINRMLRDLSSRQPASGNVMSGIQLPGATPPPARGGMLGKIGALLVLVVVFTVGLWFVFGPKTYKAPQPRQAPAGADVVAEPGLGQPAAPTAEAPVMASAPSSSGDAAQLRMDTQLSATGETPAAQAPPPPPAQPAGGQKPRPRRQPAPADAEAPPKAPAADPAKAVNVYADARRALQRGDERAAEALLLDALALDPRLHGAREDLGNLRVRQGRVDEAAATAREGLEVEPAHVGYRRLAARIELMRGQPAAAVALLEHDAPAVERDPEYHALLASALQRIGRHEEAARGYQALARQEPYQAAWWAGFGLSRDALGDSAGALAAYARARQLGDLDARVLEHINQRTRALQQQPAG
jgi:MSHA biogenesis protein MshN